MGGRKPYGFTTTAIYLDNIRTSMYSPVEAETAQILQFYRLYSTECTSFSALAEYCRLHSVPHFRGGEWNAARLSEILRNPIYVRADEAVYRYFLSKGIRCEGETEQYDGIHGCYLYNAASAGKVLVPAPHEGIVDSSLWLKCRYIAEYHRSARFGDALRVAQDNMNAQNFYGWNPAFDKGKK